MQDSKPNLPAFIKNPIYLDELKKEPQSAYYFFWDVVAASYAYDIQPTMIAYILTLMPGVSNKSKQLAESFSGYYSLILEKYQDIIEVFVPIYFTTKQQTNKYYIWGTKVVWHMKDYPESLTPSLNSVGSRVTEDLVELIQDKMSYDPTTRV